MLTTTLNRLRLRRGDDSGLTLLEMLAVILVVAILATGAFIAIQRIRGGAQSSVAKSNLAVAVTALVTAHGIDQDGALPSTNNQALADHLQLYVEDLTPVPFDKDAGSSSTALGGTSPNHFGYAWDLGPAPNQVIVAVNNVAHSGTGWNVAAGDAVWLVTMAEDGDTYCAFVVLEIGGDASKAGTRFDAAHGESTVATCGLSNTVDTPGRRRRDRPGGRGRGRRRHHHRDRGRLRCGLLGVDPGCELTSDRAQRRSPRCTRSGYGKWPEGARAVRETGNESPLRPHRSGSAT